MKTTTFIGLALALGLIGLLAGELCLATPHRQGGHHHAPHKSGPKAPAKSAVHPPPHPPPKIPSAPVTKKPSLVEKLNPFDSHKEKSPPKESKGWSIKSTLLIVGIGIVVVALAFLAIGIYRRHKNSISSAGGKVVSETTEVSTSVWDKTKSVARSIFGMTKSAASATTDTVKAAVNSDVAKKAVDGTKAAGGALVSGTKAVGGAAIDGTKAAGGALVRGTKAAGEAIVDGTKAAANSEVAQKAVDGTKAAGGAIVDGTKAAGRTTGSYVAEGAHGVGDTVDNISK